MKPPGPSSFLPEPEKRESAREILPPKPIAAETPMPKRRRPLATLWASTAGGAEGDLYLVDGEYDKSILAYQNGLNVDPNIAELKTKIQKARAAKAAEQSL